MKKGINKILVTLLVALIIISTAVITFSSIAEESKSVPSVADTAETIETVETNEHITSSEAAETTEITSKEASSTISSTTTDTTEITSKEEVSSADTSSATSTVSSIPTETAEIVSEITSSTDSPAEESVTAPSLIKISNVSTGVKITYVRNELAAKYRVYRKTGSDSYYLIDTITDLETETYIDTTATNGKKYTYKMTALNANERSSISSNPLSIYYLTQGKFSSVKNVKTHKISAKWKKNASATGYQFKRVKGTTTVTYTYKSKKALSKKYSLSYKKTYKVYVRPIKVVNDITYYGAWSSKKSIKIKK